MDNPTWCQYSNIESIGIKDSYSKSIVNTLGQIRIDLKAEYLRGGKTNAIKFSLIKLGYELGYCVYSCLQKSKSKNGKPMYKKIIKYYIHEINNLIKSKREAFEFNDHTFKNHEWLYDLHWYRDNHNTHYMPKLLPLVAEFELSKKRHIGYSKYCEVPYSEVRFDFQKLLVANADIRLMVFQVADFKRDVLDPKDGLNIYFENAIKGYTPLIGKYNFLFACYSKNQLHYIQIAGTK